MSRSLVGAGHRPDAAGRAALQRHGAPRHRQHLRECLRVRMDPGKVGPAMGSSNFSPAWPHTPMPPRCAAFCCAWPRRRYRNCALARSFPFEDRRARTTTALHLHVDSSVLVVYGRQEQARIGYNPIKRGWPSYHPLLCFEGLSLDFWHGELRAGDAHTAQGAVALLEACFTRLPSGARRPALVDVTKRRLDSCRRPA